MYRIKEVEFTGGVAGARSSYGQAQPAKAFERDLPPDQNWHSGMRGGPVSNQPIIVWYDFKSAGIRPAEVRCFLRLASLEDGKKKKRDKTCL